MVDVARHAGVSRATVSLVLRGSPLVAEATERQVRAAMAELGYVYNRGAASLRGATTHTVGVALLEITNPYFAHIAAAIESAMYERSRVVLFNNSHERPDRQSAFLEKLVEYSADGVILCPAQGTQPATIRRLARRGLPCVLVSRLVAGAEVDAVAIDMRSSARAATRYLLELGHRRIGLVGAVADVWTGAEQIAGYREALAAAGCPDDASLVVPCSERGEPKQAMAATLRLLDLPRPPTAVFCFNDVLAIGALLALAHRGLTAGRDFSVMGFNDIPEAALWRPGLTTMRTDQRRLGETACDLLLERIAHPELPVRRIEIPAELVVRGTCGPPR